MDKINILILEDDDALLLAMRKAFEKKGHEVISCQTLNELEEELTSEPALDLILLDLKLEHETSLNKIADIRAQYTKAKIFVVTGYASIATTVEAMKRGADDYLPKPISSNDILNAYFGDKEKDVEITEEPISTKRLEWEHIQRVLSENDGNISRTAQQLKMHRRTLQRKLQKKPSFE